MPADLPPTLDPVAAARWQGLPAVASPWLHEEVGRRMAERLEWIKLQPEAWLDWAPGLGGTQAHALVAARYPKSASYLAEVHADRAHRAIKNIANPWWKPAAWGRGPLRAGLPPDGGVQMVWANMALHAAPDPQALLAQWHGALAPHGFLMFSCLGPDTLREIRGIYADRGWPPPSHAFTDMHDWGDMLVQTGFAEPVMDMERITLSFATPERLLTELRGLGRNLHRNRFDALRGRAWRSQLLAQLQARLADGPGAPLDLTFEIIYGHALKPKPRVKLSAHSAVSLQDMRAMLLAGKS
jgi:malonyl-CoA O-methyltransferase